MAYGASFAQKTNKILGKVSNEKAEIVSYAFVKLLSFPDTAMVKNMETDVDGGFVFDQVKAGDYILSISLVGYKNAKTAKFTVTDSDVKLPTIKLETATKLLKEIVVENKKNFVEHRVDKTVLNVENSIVATGGTALEVLEKAPGVTIDRQNDQILLNNKNGTMVSMEVIRPDFIVVGKLQFSTIIVHAYICNWKLIRAQLYFGYRCQFCSQFLLVERRFFTEVFHICQNILSSLFS